MYSTYVCVHVRTYIISFQVGLSLVQTAQPSTLAVPTPTPCWLREVAFLLSLQHVPVMQLLVVAGCGINKMNRKGYAALHFAAQYGVSSNTQEQYMKQSLLIHCAFETVYVADTCVHRCTEITTIGSQ